MVGSLPEEKSAENDRIAQLRVRQYVVDSSQRNSVAGKYFAVPSVCIKTSFQWCIV